MSSGGKGASIDVQFPVQGKHTLVHVHHDRIGSCYSFGTAWCPREAVVFPWRAAASGCLARSPNDHHGPRLAALAFVSSGTAGAEA